MVAETDFVQEAGVKYDERDAAVRDTRRDLALLAASSGLSVYLVGVGFLVSSVFLDATIRPQAVVFGLVLASVLTYLFILSLIPLYGYFRVAMNLTFWPRQSAQISFIEYIFGEGMLLLTVPLAVVASAYGGQPLTPLGVLLGGAVLCWLGLRAR